MADKYIQLQSADGVNNLFPITMSDENLVWTNGSPKTATTSGDIDLGLTRTPRYFIIECLQFNASASIDYMAYGVFFPDKFATITSIRFDGSTNVACERQIRYSSASNHFVYSTAYYGSAWNSLGNSSGAYLIPQRLWAIY